MTKSEALLRVKLHQFIEKIDSKKVEAMYIMFQDEIESRMSSEYKLSEQEVNELNEQRKNYLAGKSKVYSWKEAEAELLAALKTHE